MKSSTEFAATIGWDWADKSHDLCLRVRGSSTAEFSKLPQTPEALHEWVAKLRQRFQGQPVAIAIETSRGPVISALLAYDFIVVFPVNPKALNSYRASFSVANAKNDASDAMLLEQYVRLHQEQIKALKPDTVPTRTLAGLVEVRRQFVDERTRLVEQLHSVLKSYFPLAQSMLADFMTLPIASDFLSRWPTLELLQKAKPHTLRSFFYAHNSRSKDLIEERLAAIAKAKALTQDSAIILPASLKVRALASMLRDLHHSIAQIEEAIEKAMDEHPDAPIFRSFPGAGPCLAPRLLVAFGTDRSRFGSAAEVAQFHGIAPVTRQSGNTKSVYMRNRCPKFSRQTFHENAGCALRADPWAAEFHAHYKSQHGGHHHQANRSLAFKLIRIYYACWRDRKPYDPARYLEALEKKGSPIAKRLQSAEKSHPKKS